jgi:hypothetical protein
MYDTKNELNPSNDNFGSRRFSEWCETCSKRSSWRPEASYSCTIAQSRLIRSSSPRCFLLTSCRNRGARGIKILNLLSSLYVILHTAAVSYSLCNKTTCRGWVVWCYNGRRDCQERLLKVPYYVLWEQAKLSAGGGRGVPGNPGQGTF